MNLTDKIKTNPFTGHVSIRDKDTDEVLVDKYNAIHPQNMALAIARSLAHENNGTIFSLALGNGGTFFTSGGTLVYKSPNVIGNSTLYNQTYEEQVDEQDSGTPLNNSVLSSVAVTPAQTALVIVTMELDSTEPSGQAAQDNISSSLNTQFSFDELGLKTQDGLLLSHIVFSPIEKTSNRAFIITYTITISVS
jgi:hypothetical protein